MPQGFAIANSLGERLHGFGKREATLRPPFRWVATVQFGTVNLDLTCGFVDRGAIVLIIPPIRNSVAVSGRPLGGF